LRLKAARVQKIITLKSKLFHTLVTRSAKKNVDLALYYFVG